jgi:hypothetical protein
MEHTDDDPQNDQVPRRNLVSERRAERTERTARASLVGFVAASKGVCLAWRPPHEEPAQFVDSEWPARLK